MDSCEDLLNANDETDVEFPIVFLNLPKQYPLDSPKYISHPYVKLPPYPVKCKTYAATGKCSDEFFMHSAGVFNELF